MATIAKSNQFRGILPEGAPERQDLETDLGHEYEHDETVEDIKDAAE
jgi:hypothetical protein